MSQHRAGTDVAPGQSTQPSDFPITSALGGRHPASLGLAPVQPPGSHVIRARPKADASTGLTANAQGPGRWVPWAPVPTFSL